ncbi:hypothetical protein NBRC116494_19860 [Aurantivibrio plasticivorans]
MTLKNNNLHASWVYRLMLAMASLVLAAHVSAAPCDRACVQSKVTQTIDAMVNHRHSDINFFASKLRSTQNGEVTQLGDGVWQTITSKGGYQQTFIDQSLQEATFFGVFTEQHDGVEEPLLMAVRFRFSDGEVTELEHLLSRPDKRNRLIRISQLKAPNPIYDVVLPESARSSRDQLVAAAHAYFDGIAKSTDEGVPMHRECVRRENGVTLLKNQNPTTEDCPIGFHRFNYITDIRDRRVSVVDEERGLVLAWGIFDIPGNIEVAPGRFGPSDLPSDGPRVDSRKVPRSLYIAELFRVVDGKIRDIDAIMYNLDLGFKAGW